MFTAQKCPSHTCPEDDAQNTAAFGNSADQGSRTDFFWGNRRELENESQNGGDDFSILFLYLYLVG